MALIALAATVLTEPQHHVLHPGLHPSPILRSVVPSSFYMQKVNAPSRRPHRPGLKDLRGRYHSKICYTQRCKFLSQEEREYRAFYLRSLRGIPLSVWRFSRDS